MSKSVIRKKVNLHYADGQSSVSLILVSSQKGSSLPPRFPRATRAERGSCLPCPHWLRRP